MALTFNAQYYYANRPDVFAAFLAAGAGVSAVEFAQNHYNNFGWKEGANPNEVFITTEYLTRYPDVAAANVNPFQHYNSFGEAEGRAPNATFPELSEFPWEAYVAQNADLQAAGIDTAAEAYNHFINFGYNEGRPGAPDLTQYQVNQALTELQLAQDAQSDALQAAALLDNANASDGATPITDPALLEAFVAGYDATQLQAEVTGAEVRVNQAISALATARANVGTDAALQADYNSDLAAVRANSAANALLTTRDTTAAAAEAHLAAEGDNAAILGELRAAISAYVAGGGDLGRALTLSAGAGATAPTTVGELLSDINAALASGTTDIDALVELFGTVNTTTNVWTQDISYAPVGASATAGEQALLDAIKVVADRDSTSDLAAEAQADLDANNLGEALIDAEAALATREALIEAVADAQEWLTVIQEAAAPYEVATEAYNAAVEALEDLGYNAPVTLTSAAPVLTTDGDILVYQDPAADGGFTSTITGFGVGGDLLIFGEGFTRVDLETGVAIGTTNQGNAGALEIFFQQQGANTVLYVEDDNFDGSLSTGFGGNTITLVGVDADSLSFENGILRVNSEAAVA